MTQVRRPAKKVLKNCAFCREAVEPDYGDVVALSKYLNERGRIIGRDRTGVCAKHQRRLAKSIKRARHLSLLPFVSEV